MYKISIIIFLVLFDLFIKQVIFYSIDLNNFIYITPFLDLVHIHNFGISFGLFSGLAPPILIVLIGLIIMVILVLFLLKSKNTAEKWGFTIIIAGGFSNIIDRIINGYVIDFAYLHYNNFYWPAFNFADIYITLGIFIIMLQFFLDLNKKVNK